MSTSFSWPPSSVPTAGPLGDLASIARWHQDTAPESDAAGAPADLPVVIGNASATVTAAATCAVLLSRDAAALTPDRFDADDRLDHQAWMTLCASIRDEIHRLEPLRDNLDELLLATEPEFADCVAALRAAAEDEQPMLVEGPVSAAAALVANEQLPESLRWLRPVQFGSTPTEELSWEYLRVTPILALHTRVADGALADLARATVATATALAADYRGSAATNGGDTT